MHGVSLTDTHLSAALHQKMLALSEAYNKSVQEESTLSAQELKTRHVGKQDPKRHLEDEVETAMGDQVVQGLGMMLLAEL